MKKRLRKKYKWASCQYHSCLCLSEPCKLGKKSCSNSWQCKNFTVMRQEMVLGRPTKKNLIKEMENKYILFLPLKKEWYELIEKGIKKEEYREIKPYWIRRFIDMDFYYWKFPTRESVIDLYHQSEDKATGKNFFRDDYCRYFNAVTFSLGYTRTRMTFEIKDFVISTGKPEWGAKPGVIYFVIKLGRRLK